MPPSATESHRATRGGFARSPGRGVSLATKTIAPLQSPGCTARSPGLFVGAVFRSPHSCRVRGPERPAGGIGIRACFRNTLVRVRIPGGVPAFFARAKALARSFTTWWMWQGSPAARAASRSAVRRGGVFPSSNGQDRGPSSRACRFDSGRERQRYSTRCSAAGQRASFGTQRTRAFLRRAGSTPAGETNHAPVAQRNEERAVTNREAEGSNPSGGANCRGA